MNTSPPEATSVDFAGLRGKNLTPRHELPSSPPKTAGEAPRTIPAPLD